MSSAFSSVNHFFFIYHGKIIGRGEKGKKTEKTDLSVYVPILVQRGKQATNKTEHTRVSLLKAPKTCA